MDCYICYEKISVDCNLLVLECCHKFHFTCFMKWEKLNCPLCRRNYSYLFPVRYIYEDIVINNNHNQELLPWKLFFAIIFLLFLTLIIGVLSSDNNKPNINHAYYDF